ncbi:aspartic peptidase domain-containing protein [Desarmillaria tabescens]|uniref:Aspartic peptidase domain-containing protein n=1 Tax=Armillaria tabescens TaxID=1929756 RepID=A0AA39U8W3_ARMTA|nr:aspartic peptidase domain-containing protein [Desarmillaria tabescens]KAK0469920.1 aspartic peptidase domain-containing protein [Desarmillaria tabescens]
MKFFFVFCLFVVAIVAGEPILRPRSISIPIQRVSSSVENGELLPAIVYQQHVNRCDQRLALMQGQPPLLQSLLRDRLLPYIPESFQGKDRGDFAEKLSIQANDIGYYGPVDLGTPPVSHQFLMDTGSADFWVGAEDCRCDDGGTCGNHSFLGPHSSKTFVGTNESWSIWYGTGQVSGFLAHDDVSIVGLELKAHKFGVAQNESADFTADSIPFDGLLGFAQTVASRQRTPTVVEALYKAHQIEDEVVSFKIPRAADGKNDGELMLGGMDPSKFQPNTTITVKNQNVRGFWEVLLDDIRVNGQSLGLKNRFAVLDTGSTLILAQPKDVYSIHQKIPGARFDRDSWIIPCQTSVVVSFVIGDKEFPIDSRDLGFFPVDENNTVDCISGISHGRELPEGPKHWLVGDVFLKNVYHSLNSRTNEITLAHLK